MKSPPLTNQLKQFGPDGSLQIVWNHLPCLIAFLDRDCRFKGANRSCCQLFGLANNDLTGKHLADVLTNSNVSQLNVILPQVWQGQTVAHELEIKRVSGIQRVQVACIPVCGETDNVQGFYIAGPDYDDRRSVRQQLAFREHELQLVLDNIPDLVASFTSDFHYVWVNKSYLNFFGLQHQEQICGKHVREIMGDAGWQRVQPYMERAISGERVVYDVEIPSASGLRNLQAVYVPNFNEQGKCEGHYALITDVHDRKLTEKAFQISEEKFRAIFKQTTIGVAQLDSKTCKFIQINDRYCEIIGYHAEELQGKTLKSVTHPEDLQQTVDKLNDLLAARIESFSIENRCIRPDQSIVYVNLTVSRMASGDVDSSTDLIVVVENITDYKEARIAQARLAAIVESSDDAIMSKSLDGMITFWNKSAEHLFGYTAEEAIGKPKAMLLPADRPNEVKQNLARIKRGEIVDHFETKRRRKDGLLIDVALSVSPVYDANKQLIGAATIARDISERKSIEAKLAESEAWFSGILNIADDAVIAIDESSQIQLFNKGAERIFGYRAEELMGQSLNLLLPKRFADKHHAHIKGFGQTPVVSRQMGERSEIYGLRKDGTEFPAEASISKLKTAKGLTFTVILRDITERKEAQRAMGRLAAIVESSDDAIMSKSLDGIITSWNKGAERLFGYTAEEAIGKPKAMLLPADRPNEVKQNLARIKRGEIVDHFETKRQHKDGSLVDVALSVSPVYGANKQLIGAATIARDISERKQIENQLAESEEWFSGILNIADDAVIAVDESSVIQLFNKGAERIFGYRAEELIGQSLSLLLPKRFADKHHAHIKGFGQTPVVSRQMGERSEIYGLRKDGTEFPAEASISKLKTAKDLTFTVILRDITERKEAQKAMGRLAAIVESSDDAILGKSLDGMITSWNKRAERLFGYTAEEAIGKPKSMLLPADRPDEVRKNLARIKDGEMIQNYETVHCHKNGLLIDVSLSVSPLHTPDGQLIGAATIARDISERKRAAEQLKSTNDRLRMLSQQMQQAKETEQKRIAQELHDEFGQALSSLKWVLAYLKREIQRQPCLNDLDNINARMEDMSTILGEAIATTRRIATALRPPMLDDLGLIPALEWLAHDFQERTKISSTFCVDPSISPKSIQDDQATVLFRITQELLTNVLRHAKASEIAINLDWKDNQLVLQVKDNGVGYRAPPNPLGGSLGLLGIQERAESLGGLFSIQGLPAQGTTAIVQIPFSM